VTPVTGLRADGVHAAEHHVVDGQRVQAGALQQRVDDVRAQVGRVRARQAPAPAADRGPDRVDQECLGHSASVRLDSIERVLF
jgi:hypothetical protein